MDYFKDISANNITVLFNIIANSTLLKKELIRRKYVSNATSFDSNVNFLVELGLLKIDNNIICLPSRYLDIKSLRQTSKTQITEKLSAVIIDILFKKIYSFSNYIKEYLAYFKIHKNKLELQLGLNKCLKYANLRNFLINLGLFQVDYNRKTIFIPQEYLLLIIDYLKEHSTTIQKFKNILRAKEIIGALAEKEIILYEKKRLSKYGYLLDKIEHISIKDVSAGYDIKSYESIKNNKDEHQIRYIEVKAVSKYDYKFYMTKNEIDKAKHYNNSYFLYLLPVNTKKTFDINDLQIVRNPYHNAYKNRSNWGITEEVVSMYKLS